MTPTPSEPTLRTATSSPSSRADQTVGSRSNTTGRSIRNAIISNDSSAASKSTQPSPSATTNSPKASSALSRIAAARNWLKTTRDLRRTPRSFRRRATSIKSLALVGLPKWKLFSSLIRPESDVARTLVHLRKYMMKRRKQGNGTQSQIYSMFAQHQGRVPDTMKN